MAGCSVPRLSVLALVVLDVASAVECHNRCSFTANYYTDWAICARCAAIKIQNFYWRHIHLVERFGTKVCQLCKKRRTYNSCEVARCSWEEPCFIMCEYCTRRWPNHPKAMGNFFCPHENETLEACYRHKGVCDGLVHLRDGYSSEGYNW
eukprot:5675577-Prymnesium_polylepis.1